jgi:hypothetical protein
MDSAVAAISGSVAGGMADLVEAHHPTATSGCERDGDGRSHSHQHEGQNEARRRVSVRIVTFRLAHLRV